MTIWVFRNVTRGGAEVAVKSADHAVELLMEASGWDEYGTIVDFVHAEKGFIESIAGAEFAALSFDPNYDRNAHSMSGFRDAISATPETKDPLYFVDDTGVVSSVRAPYVWPILEVANALKYIIEHHNYPSFLSWSR